MATHLILMLLATRHHYNERVRNIPFRGRAAVTGFLLLLPAAMALGPQPADAGPAARFSQSVAVGSSPILRVNLRVGSVEIRTWNRPTIGIQSTAGLTIRHFGAQAVAANMRSDLPIFSSTTNSRFGPVTLGQETFDLSSMSANPHDAVAVRSAGGWVGVRIEIPANTALVLANVGAGRISMRGYRSGTFVARVHTGRILMRNMGGTGFAEVVRGAIFIAGSSFERLRVRTAVGPIVCERCTVRQIDATSIAGSIGYDNGTFQPGLAHFESQYGNVAIGVRAGGAQIAAHSSSGRIYSRFDDGANVTGSARNRNATVGGGGPVVTASSGAGAVFLYNGSITAHRSLARAWQPIRRIVVWRAPPVPRPRVRH